MQHCLNGCDLVSLGFNSIGCTSSCIFPMEQFRNNDTVASLVAHDNMVPGVLGRRWVARAVAQGGVVVGDLADLDWKGLACSGGDGIGCEGLS